MHNINPNQTCNPLKTIRFTDFNATSVKNPSSCWRKWQTSNTTGLRAKSVGMPLKNGPDTVGAKLDENCNIAFILCVQCILIFKLNMGIGFRIDYLLLKKISNYGFFRGNIFYKIKIIQNAISILFYQLNYSVIRLYIQILNFVVSFFLKLKIWGI